MRSAPWRPIQALPCPVRSCGPAKARTLVASLAISLALTGCVHKTRWTPPASTLAPVDLEPLPDAATASTIAEVRPPDWIPPESAEEAPKRPARRRPAPAPTHDAAGAQQPAQVASAAEPAALAIGSLSSGGDATPQAQQQARELILTIEKRVAALPRSVVNQQKPQIKQVTHFVKQAQQALDSGDAEGAVTLATKARLLMDDIEKR